MQLIIDLPDKEGIERILELLQKLGVRDIKIRKEKGKRETYKNRDEKIDLSRYVIESFQEVDGLSYQRAIRDEW
ncbi:hypothetical protein [Nitratifractor sp.]